MVLKRKNFGESNFAIVNFLKAVCMTKAECQTKQWLKK